MNNAIISQHFFFYQNTAKVNAIAKSIVKFIIQEHNLINKITWCLLSILTYLNAFLHFWTHSLEQQ